MDFRVANRDLQELKRKHEKPQEPADVRHTKLRTANPTPTIKIRRAENETEMFECNFGPNYHPTFEVFVNVNTEEVKLSLLDKTNGKEVWVPRRILLTGTSGQDVEPPTHRRLMECEFVKKHRDELIQRVSSVMMIADGLRTKDMIPDEMYSKVHAAEPRQEKTRLLLEALDSGGASVKAEFYRLLKEKENDLVDELESGPSGPQ